MKNGRSIFSSSHNRQKIAELRQIQSVTVTVIADQIASILLEDGAELLDIQTTVSVPVENAERFLHDSHIIARSIIIAMKSEYVTLPVTDRICSSSASISGSMSTSDNSRPRSTSSTDSTPSWSVSSALKICRRPLSCDSSWFRTAMA